MPIASSTISLRWGDLELALLPAVGGRLWDVTYCGRSLLFQNPDLVNLPSDLGNLRHLPTRSPQFGFPLWGGEKTWIAPDSSWMDGAPFPVLDSGPYEVSDQSPTHAILLSEICPASGLSVRRRISLTSGHSWSIDHVVTNHGKAGRLTGIWSVMMLDTPSALTVAMPEPAFETVFGDAGTCVVEAPQAVKIACDRMREFKVGMPNPTGETRIQCGWDGPLLECVVPAPKAEDVFAHGHPFEAFNSGDYAYCEAEWHSPAKVVEPGQSLSFSQIFTIENRQKPDAQGQIGNTEEEA